MHFSLEELTRSATGERLGIDNAPPDHIMPSLYRLADGLESIRFALGDRPIMVHSGYRCPRLNDIIGGSDGSQHCLGEAADFTCPEYGDPIEVCRRLLYVGVPFDQVIYEHSWVHVSFIEKLPRQDVFTKLPNGQYAPGLIARA